MSTIAVNARKKAYVKKCEEEGLVADSMEVRMQLVDAMTRKEITNEELQDILKSIQQNAKYYGKMTRAKAWRKG